MLNVKERHFEKWLERILWVGFFLAILFLCGLIEYSDGDDAYFYSMAHSVGFFEYIRMRYIGWEGRVTSEAMTYMAFYFGKTFWQFANACILTALPFSLVRIIKKMDAGKNGGKDVYLTVAVCVGILFSDMGVIGYGAFWVTGSTFYLWSIVAGIWAAMPFVDLVYGKVNNKSFIYAIPLGFIAAMGQEQIAAVVIVFGALAVIYHYVKERTVAWFSLLEVIIMMIALILLFLSPGTGARVQSEIETWMPQFATMSAGNHIFITLQWLLSALANESKIFFIMIWVTGGVIVIKRNTVSSKFLSLCAGIEAVVAALSIFGITWFSEMGMGVEDITKCVYEVATPAKMSGQNWLAIAWWGLAFVFTLLLLWQLWDTLRDRAIAVLLLLASFASGAILYFSPTMYASGGRVLFMTQILLWLLSAMIFRRLEKKEQKVFLFVFAAAGVIQFASGASYMAEMIFGG